jgi:hypothetical protein
VQNLRIKIADFSLKIGYFLQKQGKKVGPGGFEPPIWPTICIVVAFDKLGTLETNTF